MRLNITQSLPSRFLLSIGVAFSAVVIALLFGAWLGNQIPASEAEEIGTTLHGELNS